ncbi:MAG: NAD(P)/FAD-dependent oxidoreductase [Clostridia bacterium]|nr:NAD(P)/FAD-dependent oxidoreductase [Clostridia bacterium]
MAEILIIGGGVAGLSAGIYAQLSGHHATICERQALAGGNLTGWQRGDYHIDNCIHWLTGTNPKTALYQMWTELGALGKVKVHQPNTLYTYEEGGVCLSVHFDLDKMQEELLSIAPEDEKEIKSLIKAVRAVQSFKKLSGEKRNVFLRELQALPRLFRYYRMTTGELAARFKNPYMQGFITSMLGEDFAALALLIVFATFCGGNGGIPVGSSLAMAKRMTTRFLNLGGTLMLSKEATAISEGETGVQIVEFSDGTMLTADYVVIATEPNVAFEKLLGEAMPTDMDKRYKNPKMPRFSSIHCAFACKTDNLPFHADFIFKLPKKEQAALKTENLIIREYSHEKAFAPEGETIIQSLTFCNETTCREFIEMRKNPIKYRAKKKELAQIIQNAIERKFPQLSGKLQLIDVWTPATYHRYTNAEIGSYMAFLLPSKTLPKKLNNLVKGRPRVILASQWLQSPGGLPIAAQVGKDAILRINQKEKIKKSI